MLRCLGFANFESVIKVKDTSLNANVAFGASKNDKKKFSQAASFKIKVSKWFKYDVRKMQFIAQ